MQTDRPFCRIRSKESGFSLLELMIAVVILTVGLLGTAVLITAAINSDNRSKLDSAGTMLAQKVIETVAAQPTGSGAAAPTMQDCNPAGAQNWTIKTVGAAAPGAGAQLDANTANIDFTNQAYGAVPAGYAMRYVGCGAAGQQVTYDVRWNIQTLPGNQRLITVAARQIGASNQLRLSAPPVNLRTAVLN